jgi:hypothetical protein
VFEKASAIKTPIVKSMPSLQRKLEKKGTEEKGWSAFDGGIAGNQGK